MPGIFCIPGTYCITELPSFPNTINSTLFKSISRKWAFPGDWSLWRRQDGIGQCHTIESHRKKLAKLIVPLSTHSSLWLHAVTQTSLHKGFVIQEKSVSLDLLKRRNGRSVLSHCTYNQQGRRHPNHTLHLALMDTQLFGNYSIFDIVDSCILVKLCTHYAKACCGKLPLALASSVFSWIPYLFYLFVN